MSRISAIASLLFLAACGHGHSLDLVRRSHAGNFGCDVANVQARSVEYDGWQNRGTFLADGCGVRQTYSCFESRCAASGTAVRTDGSGPRFVAGGSMCDPACLPGYTCRSGVCRAFCEPSCEPGFYCAENRQCLQR